MRLLSQLRVYLFVNHQYSHSNPKMNHSDSNKHSELNNLLYPRSRYRGPFSPQDLAFNANLQEFSQRIGYICALETGGKLTSMEAYQEIRQLWKKLKKSKKELGVGASGSPSNDA